MLQISNLKAGYGRLNALRGIDLSVKKSEIVFIVGPNGAGKSTLLKVVSGLMKPWSGEIRFENEVINGQPPERLCREGLVLVPEGRSIFSSLTVEENLALGGMGRRDKDVLEADLDTVLNTFPILRERIKGVAGHLSGGEQQQLAIARAILQQPALIMIDEPSLGLAPLMIDEVYASLKALNERTGMTLLIVEQSTARILKLADRVNVLRNGEIVLSKHKSEIGDPALLEEAYFGYVA
ncbi:ABC transporter ATP-binding protein [Sulfitobacter dubius]|uniref:High-affinity branched-chain amino acid transport ATP-binding protein LivF n=1 Tax=Sulfitobacter dubius TaxID=218673 RepID=A0ABY3ZR21_9RHOB|nr:ABC transporter ATP-binding protein [Sulfitobacter dubius]UOA16932.1 High-affinity branched-chain amino acid transport ATP-binding protein LivF [Sulfitobacter dubius]